MIEDSRELCFAVAALSDVHRHLDAILHAIDVADSPVGNIAGETSAKRVNRPAASQDGGALIDRLWQRCVDDASDRETDG